MGKLMINGEQYPAIVVKAGLDDTQTRKDATWSSDKINEELEDVRNELDIIVEEANKNTTINDEATSLTTTWSSKKTSDEINAQTANRQVKTFDNTSSSTEKWYKICSAITGGISCNMKLTASRADSTATVQYFSALFRDNRYRYTSSYISRERTVYEFELAAEYSTYIIADANNDIWVHVPSYGKVIIEIDTRAVVIDGTAGTPVKDYVYSSFEHQYDERINDTESSNLSTYSSAKIDSKLAKYTKKYSGAHSRYIKIGSVPISSGVVTKTTLIMSLFAMSDVSTECPVGLLNINISSGSGGNVFNINGTTTILLNNTNNLNTPRIVVDKTSTHYNLYVDCKYTYMWIEYMILNQDSNYVNGNFEALDALEGTEYWSSVTSDDIKYVGDLAKLDDTSTSETSTWSSSKIASEISQRFPNLSIPSTKALKITRNSIFSAFIKVMDVHGNLFTLQCGDQDNRFYVIPSYIGTNLSVDITKFVKEATACYLYSNTYSMYVLEVIGDVSYSVIDKTAITSTATETTITQ